MSTPQQARQEGRLTFRLKPVAAIATAAAVAILMTLGTWQLDRLEWKQALVAKIDARIVAEPISFRDAVVRAKAGEDMTYTPVTLTGVYNHEYEAHVYGTWEAKPGVYVFTPLDSNGDGVVYINRGFAPVQLKRSDQRADGLVGGEVTVSGLFRAHMPTGGVAALFQPVDNPSANEWHQRNPIAFAASHGLQTLPYYIDSSGVENVASWPQGGVTRIAFNNRHMEYALTWFGLAATALGVFVFFSLERR